MQKEKSRILNPYLCPIYKDFSENYNRINVQKETKRSEMRISMKSVKRKFLTVIAAAAVMVMALTGCGEKLAPANETVSALFELSAKDNAEPMMELLGFASKEDANNAFFVEGTSVELADEIKSQVADLGVAIDESEIQEFSDAMLAMADKLAYTAEITSEEKDKVTVTMNVTGFSYEAVVQVTADAMTAMMESVTQEDQLAIAEGDMDLLASYMSQYLKDITAGMSALEPTETVTFTVPCERLRIDVSGEEKIAWLPSDMEQFSKDVEGAVYQ